MSYGIMDKLSEKCEQLEKDKCELLGLIHCNHDFSCDGVELCDRWELLN